MRNANVLTRLERVASAGVLAGAALALSLPAVAQADVAGRIFTLAGDGTEWRSSSTAATGTGLSPSAIAASGDGRVVMVDASRPAPRLIRVDPDGTWSQILAFAGATRPWHDVSVSPSGDVFGVGPDLYRAPAAGPPIVLDPAQEGGFSRVAADADGGLLIADTSRGRILRRSIAGQWTAVLPERSLETSDIESGRAGRVVIGENNGSIDVIERNGAVHRIAAPGPSGAGSPASIAVQPNGTVLQTYGLRRIAVLRPDGTRRIIAGRLTATQAPSADDGLPATEVGIWPTALAVTADGSAIFIDGNRVRYVASKRPMYLGIGQLIRSGRATAGRYRATFALTRPAEVTVWLWRVTGDDFELAGERRARGLATATNQVTIQHKRAPGLYQVELEANSRSGQTVSQSVYLFLGGKLPAVWARAMLDTRRTADASRLHTTDEDEMLQEDDPVATRTGPCSTLSSIRVDCRVETKKAAGAPFVCSHVATVQLRDTGEIVTRSYRCSSSSTTWVQRTPKWRSGWQSIDLDSFANSTWPAVLR